MTTKNSVDVAASYRQNLILVRAQTHLVQNVTIKHQIADAAKTVNCSVLKMSNAIL